MTLRTGWKLNVVKTSVLNQKLTEWYYAQTGSSKWAMKSAFNEKPIE